MRKGEPKRRSTTDPNDGNAGEVCVFGGGGHSQQFFSPLISVFLFFDRRLKVAKSR